MGKDAQYRVAYYGLIRNDAGKYLLLRRSPECRHFAGQWQMPGGKPDPGESADQTLRREVREECGLEISVEGLTGCTDFPLKEFRVVMVVFLCRHRRGEVELSDEHTAAAWVEEGGMLERDLTAQDRRFLAAYRGRKTRGMGPAVCVTPSQ